MSRSTARGHLRPAVVAAVLALFAVTGLGAGLTTGTALGRLGLLRAATATATSPAHVGATTSPSPSPARTIAPFTGRFTLDVVAAPRPVAAGGHLSITATATAQDGHSPAPGVRCVLKQLDGATTLPLSGDSVTTDAVGRATWDVAMPASVSGSYGLEVAGQAASYQYHVDFAVSVSG